MPAERMYMYVCERVCETHTRFDLLNLKNVFCLLYRNTLNFPYAINFLNFLTRSNRININTQQKFFKCHMLI